MKRVFSLFFTWWNGATVGTLWHTYRHGRLVGSDEFGNQYFTRNDSDRRWVIYHGDAEASKIPPEWHAWLHGLTQSPPTVNALTRQSWEKQHESNQTGTENAHQPSGSLLRNNNDAQNAGYQAWVPGKS
jgi:NADH:ubiquinone oxidoreductase subunit